MPPDARRSHNSSSASSSAASRSCCRIASSSSAASSSSVAASITAARHKIGFVADCCRPTWQHSLGLGLGGQCWALQQLVHRIKALPLKCSVGKPVAVAAGAHQGCDGDHCCCMRGPQQRWRQCPSEKPPRRRTCPPTFQTAWLMRTHAGICVACLPWGQQAETILQGAPHQHQPCIIEMTEQETQDI